MNWPCVYVFGSTCTAAESYQEGDVRLVDGPQDWEGRVEIHISGTWGTISDERWTVQDAVVICRQLGHSTSGEILSDYMKFDGYTCCILSTLRCVTNIQM